MSAIDVEGLLVEISPDAPAGENLEYDPLFLEMERAAQGRPEQQMGDETIPAQAPNWAEVKKKALELAARTKDLRVGVNLANAVARTDDLPSLRDALTVLLGYVEQYWESVHPQLDPEDDNDPIMRVNTLAALRDPDGVIAAVRATPLVRSQLAGSFSFKDVLVARGDLPAPEDAEAPTLALIDGAFSECDLAELQATADACIGARETVVALEARLTERVGAMHAADLSALPEALGQVHGFLVEKLAERGVTVGGVAEAETSAEEAAGAAAPGEIRSRDDVVRTLDRITRYYEAHEPSSPVPLLMERAKRLVYANFVELVQDLAPDGLAQVQNIRGVKSSEED